jgi:hypothetical protein
MILRCFAFAENLSYFQVFDSVFMVTENAPASISRTKKVVFKLLFVLIGIFVGALIGEIALRVIGYSTPEFYAVDEARGYALAPNVKGWYRKEGRTYIEINSDALRDVEHAVQKPANTLRIAVIGDSYAEALQVDLEEIWWRIMQDKLNSCAYFARNEVEVINFGVSGYGTAQEYITLKEKVWKYSPDIVILAVTTNNDITDNYRPFKKTEIPYFVFEGNELVLDNSFQNSAKFRFDNSSIGRAGSWVKNNLRIIQAIQDAQTALKYRWTEWTKRSEPPAAENKGEDAKPAEAQKPQPQAGDVGIDNVIYRVPRDDQWKEAWKVTEGLILKMNEEVRAHEAKFVVVTLSNGAQVMPDPTTRAAHLSYLGAEDVFYPDDRIRKFAEAHSIRAIMLAPALQAYAEQNNIFLHGFDRNLGFGHWNQNGHRIAGEIIGETFCHGFD